MKIYVAGHTGMVGSSLVREIQRTNLHEWVGATRTELDLRSRADVFKYIEANKPDAVIIAAAKVGGILSNRDFPVDFLSDNLQIETNLIDASHAFNVERLVFLGSSCVYPKFAPQPIKETDLFSGALEESNESYALAKISGIKLVDAYKKQYGHRWYSLMPTNLYGPGDNFDPYTSHVIPGLIAKLYAGLKDNQSSVVVWGSGSPLREFLHVDDLARAVLTSIEASPTHSLLNVGSGEEVSIRELAVLLSRVVGFKGYIDWDTSKPDGTPRKLLDSGRIRQLGWQPEIRLEAGLEELYKWFVSCLDPKPPVDRLKLGRFH